MKPALKTSPISKINKTPTDQKLQIKIDIKSFINVIIKCFHSSKIRWEHTAERHSTEGKGELTLHSSSHLMVRDRGANPVGILE